MGTFLQNYPCGCTLITPDNGAVELSTPCDDETCPAHLHLLSSKSLPNNLDSWMREEISYNYASKVADLITQQILSGNWNLMYDVVTDEMRIEAAAENMTIEPDHRCVVVVPSFEFDMALIDEEDVQSLIDLCPPKDRIEINSGQYYS